MSTVPAFMWPCFTGPSWVPASTEDQRKQPHAPFRAEQIETSGLHFAFLGHYHAPRDKKHFTYPGNPEPLTFGETGQRGVVIATIGADGHVLQTVTLLPLAMSTTFQSMLVGVRASRRSASASPAHSRAVLAMRA